MCMPVHVLCTEAFSLSPSPPSLYFSLSGSLVLFTFSLLVICNYHNRSDLMKLMISCLDFAHDVKSRVILSKVLTSADPKMRLYATKHMRVLLRSKMPFFNSWGLEMVIYQVK